VDEGNDKLCTHAVGSWSSVDRREEKTEDEEQNITLRRREGKAWSEWQR
jgi:hypothetical protein